MPSYRTASRRGGSRVGLALVLIALFGCGGGPKVHPVKGRLVFDKGDVKLLAGSILNCQNEQNPSVSARGDINEDGSFTLETYARGRIVPGAIEGTYRARIIPENGSDESLFRRTHIDPKFLDGKASSLTFKVPTDGDVVLTVTKAKPGTRLPSDKPKSGTGCDDPPDEPTPGSGDTATFPN
jgi:hypothetical protein